MLTHTHPDLHQRLHEFPLTPEVEGIDFVDLAQQASERFAGKNIMERLWMEPSETLSHGDNEVYVLRTDDLPSGGFKFLSAGNSAAEALEAGHTEVVTATAGTFGTALGHSDIAVTAFMPVGGSPGKKQAMEDLGVTVTEQGSNVDETRVAALQYAEKSGKKFLDPYAALSNLAGTAILGLAIARLKPDLTDVVTQFGGGSAHGGVAPVVRQLIPEARLSVVQVAGCSPFVDSVLTGEIHEAKDAQTRHSSYLRKLGGVGVGKLHPLTLGHGSRYVDRVSKSYIDQVYATMHDYEQEHGDLPEFAAAVGLEGARRLARTPGLQGATIVALFTGGRPEAYLPGYLANMSHRRKLDEADGR
jgi:threonine dehydratase